jgi:hypothetical protein
MVVPGGWWLNICLPLTIPGDGVGAGIESDDPDETAKRGAANNGIASPPPRITQSGHTFPLNNVSPERRGIFLPRRKRRLHQSYWGLKAIGDLSRRQSKNPPLWRKYSPCQ